MVGASSTSSIQALKTVAVLGASYGGARVACLLANGLPQNWRVVLIDRNSHMNHLYVLPRYAVLPGHEHKAFIPYDNVFLPPALPAASSSDPPQPPKDLSRHVRLHASVLSLREHELTLDKSFPEHGIPDQTLRFEYLVYALGSHLPSPINLWGPVADEEVEKNGVVDVVRGTKEGGVAWLKRFQKRVERASSVLVVGGGALGIQYATDIAEIYPATRVTLLHSRHRLLPRFDEAMHTEILSSLSALNVCTILGDRLDLSSLEKGTDVSGAERIVRTQSGREIRAELVLLCTGQTPNTALLRETYPNVIVPDGPNKGMARVRRTLQLAEPVDEAEVPAPVSQEPLASAEPVSESAQSPVQELETALAQVELEGEEETEGAEGAEEDEPEPEPAPPIEEDPHTRVAAEHIFAIGDAADAFGAVNAGHNAFFQGEVAARNILRLVERDERRAAKSASSLDSAPSSSAPSAELSTDSAADSDVELDKYNPGAPAIKVSLGLTKSVYQFQGMIGTRDKEPADLDVHLIWRYFGHQVEREDLEHDPEAAPAPAAALEKHAGRGGEGHAVSV
ncbi:FAD/NAD(P)-binding domain-containing protein [Trametes coccinea BRFM310]|uniref:FAD/NAD(P)-binding domain-containing protein n=1 Tax=Trametes coccinea (strain BRFM310) TaxID=1353009 RepID=A0A1Y2IGE2_TRAC3|nr:FAD/NAD(P)-binding domain-containing protein [Trametes coccinea BRFM310]